MPLREHEVYITRFASEDAPGFAGVIKHRFRDFLVNEIGPDGEVYHLSDLGHVEEDEVVTGTEDTENELASNSVDGKDVLSKGLKALRPLIGEQSVIQVHRLLMQCEVFSAISTVLESSGTGSTCVDDDSTACFVLVEVDDKGSRTKIHDTVREFFGKWLATDTVLVCKEEPACRLVITKQEGNGSKRVLRIMLRSMATVSPERKNANASFRNRKRRKMEHSMDKRSASNHVKWPTGRGRFLRFILYKENLEMSTALRMLGRRLGIGLSLFSYAGTKDKRGVTVQKVSVKGVRSDRMAKASRDVLGLETGNYDYVNQPIKLGDHSGNHFSIILRNINTSFDKGVTIEEKQIMKIVSTRLDHWEKFGFLNYFGMQRFGTTDIPTFDIGVALWKGDYLGAIKLLLVARDTDGDDFKAALEEFKTTGKATSKLFACLPKDLTAARGIVQSLSVKASKLMEQRSVDSISLGEYEAKDYIQTIRNMSTNVRTMYVHSYQSLVFNRLVSARAELYGNQVVAGDLVLKATPDENAKQICESVAIATEEDIAGGVWTIADIVLPLVGSDLTKYPQHEINEKFIREVMSENGLDLQNCSSMTPKGSYRRVFCKPRSVKYEFLEYENDDADLALCDMDILNGVKLNYKTDCEKEPKKIALRLSFCLDTSSYATMGFRELMKCSTDLYSIRQLSCKGST